MLKNKKILFIAPDFFNYSNLIRNNIETLGATVSLFNNRPSSNLSKLLGLFSKRIYEKIKTIHYSNLLNSIENYYDYILIIRADLIPTNFLKQLRNKYTHTKFIQYVWDDVDLFPKLLDSFQYFDRVLSYDLIDANKYNLEFRPFFFIDQKDLKNISSPPIYELFFIGSFHTDRLQVLEKIVSLNPEIKVHSHFYINPIIFILNKIPLRKRHLFKFRKMKYSKMINMFQKSMAILDIQNVSQHGLTTRIFEALGTKSKILTTNKNILNYEFYNENNILIIDRDMPFIEKSWINCPYEEYNNNLLKKYHIKDWIIDVFDI